MEIDSSLEVLHIAEAACGFLDPLDGGVDVLQPRIGESMRQVRQHVGQMPPDQLGDLSHRRQPTVGGNARTSGQRSAECPRGRHSPRTGGSAP